VCVVRVVGDVHSDSVDGESCQWWSLFLVGMVVVLGEGKGGSVGGHV